MPQAQAQVRGARFLLLAAALVIVVAGLREIKPIALPLAIATFLSALSSPLVAWLRRRRVPTALSVLLTVLCNLAAAAALLLLVAGSVSAFSRSLPSYQQRLESKTRPAVAWLEAQGIFDYLERQGFDQAELDWLRGRSPPETPPSAAGEPPRARDPSGASFIDVGAIFGVVTGTLRSLASLMTGALLVFLMMVFILFEAAQLPRKLELALGWKSEDLARMTRARQEIQRYLGIKTLISMATGVAVTFWVWLAGVDYPTLWGLVAFILNYIPTLGSFVAAIPAVALALIQLGPGNALLLALGYVVVNVAFGSVLEPHLMGRQFGISTLVVFLSLLFWGWVWGPIGMLLSVPLTMILKILLEHTDDFRWVAQLIGAHPLPPPAADAAAPDPT